MKKVFGLVVTACFMVALVGCGGASTAKSTKVTETKPAGETKAAETKMEEKK